MNEDPRTRQWQAALVWAGVFIVVAAVHLMPGGRLLVVFFALAVAAYLFRVLAAVAEPLASDPAYRPSVSILVAAKNEEAVVGQLVRMLRAIDYPVEVWIADDGSTDRTYPRLIEASSTWGALNILRRPAGSPPGKSAVLNELCAKATGELLVVFDADAQVAPDFLARTVPLFAQPQLGALQMRKSILNASENFWTRGQAVEMLFDAFMQQSREAAGGTAELRGNGQIVRTSALQAVDGWNEQTVTDDLDLTFKLHLAGFAVHFTFEPFVHEEGVTTWEALWRQRSRWAEGGFQRYLDYAGLLIAGRLGPAKSFDQAIFCTIQYLMPLILVIDLLLALMGGYVPYFTPLALVATLLGAAGFYLGQRQAGLDQNRALTGVFLGTLYFLHWFPVIVVKLAQMVLSPKKLVWIKTAHQGS